MEPVEIVEVGNEKVVCNGVGGALGHPRVYLNMGGADHVDCPYCGRRFKYTDSAIVESDEEEPGPEAKGKWSFARLFGRG